MQAVPTAFERLRLIVRQLSKELAPVPQPGSATSWGASRSSFWLCWSGPRDSSCSPTRRELLEAERAMVMDLRQKGVIDGETMRRVERGLDLEDSRLEV